MRIAVLNSWLNLEYSAEREFISRLKLACLKLGWTCIGTVTSDDILNADVDCVIATHEYSPKLTQVPTIGLLWNPPDDFRDDPIRVRNILSYDGYLAGSDSVREYLDDLLFSTNKNSPVSKFDVLPSAPSAEFLEPNLSDPSLFYAGIHWHGKRHEKLIKTLCSRLPISFYGDPAKWARFGNAYKGRIPFDGKSIFEKINAAGVALCLHRAEHLQNGVSSMRIFESAAASAVVITENSIWAKRHFGESVLYVDQDASDSEKARQVIEHFDWIRSHPSEARDLAVQANSIFNQQFSLENFLGHLPTFLQQVRGTGCFVGRKQDRANSKVEAIVRVGGRGLFFVERCLDSLAAQCHANLGYGHIKGCRKVLTVYDMIHEIYPDDFPSSDHTSRSKQSATARADHIICISESTKCDLVRLFDVSERKISVIHLGFDPFIDASQHLPQTTIAKRPYLLYVGQRGDYKNFKGVLRAVAKSPRLLADFEVVAFGGGKFSTAECNFSEALGFSAHQVRHIAGDDNLLGSYYRDASALVYPSLYEGFGLPPLEAMSCGCPVVSSNTSSMPEIIGDAAEYFDPSDTQDICRAIEMVVYSDSRALTLKEAGKKRLSNYSWERCSQETLEAYQSIL